MTPRSLQKILSQVLSSASRGGRLKLHEPLRYGDLSLTRMDAVLTARSLARQVLGTEIADLVPYRVLYETYMASQMWRERRQSFLVVAGKICVGCGSTDEIEVHHRSYERFTHELDEDLRPVCSTCHLWIHHYERTNKISLASATDMVLSQPRTVASRRQKPPPVGRELSQADKALRVLRTKDNSSECRRKLNGL